MIKKVYSWLYKATSKKDERGESFGGLIQGAVRKEVLGLCSGSSGKALDIGTGSGLFVIKLASQNPALKIWSIDTNDEYMDLTAKKIAERSLENIHLLQQNAQEMSFDDDSFDLVICINLFLDMNMETVIRVLKEMKRVCKESGRIIFEFRNSRNSLFRLKYKLAKYYDPSAPYPLYTYDPEKIDEILRNLEMRVTDKRYIGFSVKRFAPVIIVEARKGC